MLRGLALSALLLLPIALAAAAPTPGSPAAWWEDTLLDADRDGLDDALAPLLSGSNPLTVLVAYDRVPTAEDRDALARGGFLVRDWFANFDVLVVEALPADVPSLLAYEGVVFVERNDDLFPLLKESVPLLGVPQVWKQYNATGRGITVAVLDDGAFEQHPDLRTRVAGSFDAATDVGQFGGPAALATPVVPAGENGHGTHVAGTIVGPGTQSNGQYRGVAPNARFVDVKVFRGPNQTSSDIVLSGMDWVMENADRLGVRVLSMSLGGRASDGKDAISRAVNVAVDEGFIVVAAAGNAGPGAKTITSPGAAEKAITVGAVDKSKKIAPYSSRGPTLDGRTKPDVVAPGSGITSTIPPVSTTTAASFLSGSREVYYGALSGTSMATPHVSGVVALMLEVNPDLAAADVKRILLATAQDLGAAGRENETGYGFVNAIAAVQVARDPELLQSAQFRGVLATIEDPAPEGFVARMEYEYQALQRDGKLPYVAGAAVTLLALVIFGVALVGRRKP